ncbi:hypothetical protein KCU81_g6269, partial [Aureobasidium melanogenum]|uniref:Uncharacterized protein n=1 Tax=Aureobasidium melanogenum (strain CBS 110374) TaxID=1043003 RepID=A0A074VNI3_AURM1
MDNSDFDGTKYLGDMFNVCASNQDGTVPTPQEVEARWRWFVGGVINVGDSLVDAQVMQTTPLLAHLRKALDKTEAGQASAPDGPRRSKRQKTSKKGEDTLDEDDVLLLAEAELDGGGSDKDKTDKDKTDKDKTNDGDANKDKAVKPVDAPAAQKERGKNKCLLEKTKVFSVIPSGLDSDWPTKVAIYMRSMGDDPCTKASEALQRILITAFSLDGVQNASALARSLRESQDVVSTILRGRDHNNNKISSPHQVLGHAIQHLLIADVNTTFAKAQLLSEHHNTAHLLATQIEALHNKDELLYPLYEAAYTSSLGRKDSLASFRAFLVNNAIEHMYGASDTSNAIVEKSLRIGEVLFWLQRAFGTGVFALLVGVDWKKLAYEAWNERVPGILEHAAKVSPSLRQVCKLAEENVWSHLTNGNGVTMPRNLKYDILTNKEYWATGLAFALRPEDVEQISKRCQYIIAHIAGIMTNVASMHKSKKGALSQKVPELLWEASKIPLSQATSAKRKKPHVDTPKAKKVKSSNLVTPEHTMYATPNGLTTVPQTPPPTTTITSPTLPPATTTVTSPTPVRKQLPLLIPLSPSRQGSDWRTIWQDIISKVPDNPKTNSPPTWPSQLTSILDHIWGPAGINSTLDMAMSITKNFGMYCIDADFSIINTQSPVRELEQRFKRIWLLSKDNSVHVSEAILEYKHLADAFVSLEQETHNKSTQLGQLWEEREHKPKLETSEQARSNFVMKQVMKSMHPEEMTKDEEKREKAKLQKERTYAFNMAMFIRLFGWGVVPLLANAPWRQPLGNVPASTLWPYLSRLAELVPILRVICERLDENFFQFIRKPGAIKNLPAQCLQGMTIEKRLRTQKTMSYLLARAGQCEEPGSLALLTNQRNTLEGGEQVERSNMEGGKEKTTTSSPQLDFIE